MCAFIPLGLDGKAFCLCCTNADSQVLATIGPTKGTAISQRRQVVSSCGSRWLAVGVTNISEAELRLGSTEIDSTESEW